MRIKISFGGGPRHNRNRHYGPHRNRHSHGRNVALGYITLGPIGSAIVSFIAMLFLAFITFIFAISGVVIVAVVTGIMLIIFGFVFVSNIKAIRNGRDE